MTRKFTSHEAELAASRAENQRLRNELNRIGFHIHELRIYLQSSKFSWPDNAWVNPQDVLNRLPSSFEFADE